MGRRAVDDVFHGGMQTLITGIHLHVHHVPALELNVADLPFLACGIARKDEAAFARAYQDIDLAAHVDSSLKYWLEFCRRATASKLAATPTAEGTKDRMYVLSKL